MSIKKESNLKTTALSTLQLFKARSTYKVQQGNPKERTATATSYKNRVKYHHHLPRTIYHHYHHTLPPRNMSLKKRPQSAAEHPTSVSRHATHGNHGHSGHGHDEHETRNKIILYSTMIGTLIFFFVYFALALKVQAPEFPSSSAASSNSSSGASRMM